MMGRDALSSRLIDLDLIERSKPAHYFDRITHIIKFNKSY